MAEPTEIRAFKTTDGKLFESKADASQHQAKGNFLEGLKALFSDSHMSEQVIDGITDLKDDQREVLERLLQDYRIRSKAR